MTTALAVAALVVSGALFIVGMVRHRRVTRAPAPDRWPSVPALQRAGSGRVMSRLLDQLGAAGREAFRLAVRIDGRMIVPGYAVFLAVLSLVSIAAVRHASSGGLEAVGVTVAVVAAGLALVAGGLDLVENHFLVEVLDGWHDIPIPEKPAEEEARQRQEQRRQQVAATDAPSRKVAAACTWKLRLIGVVLAWLSVAGIVAVSRALW